MVCGRTCIRSELFLTLRSQYLDDFLAWSGVDAWLLQSRLVGVHLRQVGCMFPF